MIFVRKIFITLHRVFHGIRFKVRGLVVGMTPNLFVLYPSNIGKNVRIAIKICVNPINKLSPNCRDARIVRPDAMTLRPYINCLKIYLG